MGKINVGGGGGLKVGEYYPKDTFFKIEDSPLQSVMHDKKPDTRNAGVIIRIPNGWISMSEFAASNLFYIDKYDEEYNLVGSTTVTVGGHFSLDYYVGKLRTYYDTGLIVATGQGGGLMIDYVNLIAIYDEEYGAYEEDSSIPLEEPVIISFNVLTGLISIIDTDVYTTAPHIVTFDPTPYVPDLYLNTSYLGDYGGIDPITGNILFPLIRSGTLLTLLEITRAGVFVSATDITAQMDRFSFSYSRQVAAVDANYIYITNMGKINKLNRQPPHTTQGALTMNGTNYTRYLMKKYGDLLVYGGNDSVSRASVSVIDLPSFTEKETYYEYFQLGQDAYACADAGFDELIKDSVNGDRPLYISGGYDKGGSMLTTYLSNYVKIIKKP